jgi:hypothetical protein
MAKFIKSRTSSQCRTRHQHVIRKNSNLDAAIKKYIKETPEFYNVYDQAKSSLETIENDEFLEDNCKVIKHSQSSQKNIFADQSFCMQQQTTEISSESPLFFERTPTKYDDYQRVQLVNECHFLFNEWLRKISDLTLFYRI